jgi:ribosome-binding factor A
MYSEKALKHRIRFIETKRNQLLGMLIDPRLQYRYDYLADQHERMGEQLRASQEMLALGHAAGVTNVFKIQPAKAYRSR